MTGIPGGSIILTPLQARMLYDAAHLGELRTRLRGSDSTLYAIVHDITVCAFTTPIAASGNQPRQSAASEERETWTVNQLAKTTGRAPRTVRLDIENGDLPATKIGGAWLISSDAAKTYIASRRPN